MLYKSKAIVLHHLKYGDSSLVVTMYTEQAGRKSFLVQGVYKRKTKFPPTFFQCFTLLDLQVYLNPKRELQRIKELTLSQPFYSIPFDTTKSAITLFLGEILYKILKEEEANPLLFNFIYHAIELLDVKDSGIANFHLVFMINLSKHLGFYPIDNYSELNCIFDPVNGRFLPDIAMQTSEDDKKLSFWVHQLLNTPFDKMEGLELSHKTRSALLKWLIDYYNHHLGGLNSVKSLSVLQSVFE